VHIILNIWKLDQKGSIKLGTENGTLLSYVQCWLMSVVKTAEIS
jgi:hypothetical protein